MLAAFPCPLTPSEKGRYFLFRCGRSLWLPSGRSVAALSPLIVEEAVFLSWLCSPGPSAAHPHTIFSPGCSLRLVWVCPASNRVREAGRASLSGFALLGLFLCAWPGCCPFAGRSVFAALVAALLVALVGALPLRPAAAISRRLACALLLRGSTTLGSIDQYKQPTGWRSGRRCIPLVCWFLMCPMRCGRGPLPLLRGTGGPAAAVQQKKGNSFFRLSKSYISGAEDWRVAFGAAPLAVPCGSTFAAGPAARCGCSVAFALLRPLPAWPPLTS